MSIGCVNRKCLWVVLEGGKCSCHLSSPHLLQERAGASSHHHDLPCEIDDPRSPAGEAMIGGGRQWCTAVVGNTYRGMWGIVCMLVYGC